METQPDFRELLALFSAHHVEYLIVGGYALAFHGAPRFTGDLDILVHPDAVNAQRILTVLEAFGFASVGMTSNNFERPDQVVQLGVPPVRIDLITSITDVSWDEAWAGRIAGSYGDIPVYYIGREQFIVNKRATGRTKDLADLEMLGGSVKPSAHQQRRQRHHTAEVGRDAQHSPAAKRRQRTSLRAATNWVRLPSRRCFRPPRRLSVG